MSVSHKWSLSFIFFKYDYVGIYYLHTWLYVLPISSFLIWWLIIFGKQYTLCNFLHPLVTSCLIYQNTLLSNPFSSTQSVFFQININNFGFSVGFSLCNHLKHLIRYTEFSELIISLLAAKNVTWFCHTIFTWLNFTVIFYLCMYKSITYLFYLLEAVWFGGGGGGGGGKGWF
jgi:hypothetical protein